MLQTSAGRYKDYFLTSDKDNREWCEKRKETWGDVIYCSEGRCLPADGIDNVLCDHYADCLNGEDEDNCGMFK